MQIVVPFAAETPKTRLASVLDSDERATIARAMLADVVDAIETAGHDPLVVSTAPIEIETPTAVDDRSLTRAVNARLEAASGPIGIVMADLALVTPTAIDRLCAHDGDVVIAPGRGGGTNALVVRHPAFRVDYHGGSYLDHQAIAREAGLRLESIDSFRLATDIDEPADLVEVLVHGSGRARTQLRSLGFELDRSEGRVTLDRSQSR